MDTDEALDVAREFLEEFDADSFATTEALVAAALLWGEHLGVTRTRMLALQAMAEARKKVMT